MKTSTTTALILATGTVLAAVVTGGFGLFRGNSADASPKHSSVDAPRDPTVQVDSSGINNPGTIAAPVVQGNNSGDVAGRDINKSTTIINPPPAPTFDELWRQVGDPTGDRCSHDIVTVKGGKDGDVQIREGETKFIEMANAQSDLTWYCGDSMERCACGHNFGSPKADVAPAA
jgi:hypothetical protein